MWWIIDVSTFWLALTLTHSCVKLRTWFKLSQFRFTAWEWTMSTMVLSIEQQAHVCMCVFMVWLHPNEIHPCCQSTESIYLLSPPHLLLLPLHPENVTLLHFIFSLTSSSFLSSVLLCNDHFLLNPALFFSSISHHTLPLWSPLSFVVLCTFPLHSLSSFPTYFLFILFTSTSLALLRLLPADGESYESSLSAQHSNYIDGGWGRCSAVSTPPCHNSTRMRTKT